MRQIVTVLRSGGEFKPRHVRAVYQNIEHHFDGEFTFVVLTDQMKEVSRVLRGKPWVVVKALENDWPGWWAKMEVFAFRGYPFKPHYDKKFLYMDIDTVIVGDFSPLFQAEGDLVLLKDFYHPRDKWGSGLMRITPGPTARRIFDLFTTAPERWMVLNRRWGDQAFLQMAAKELPGIDPTFWQDTNPGMVVSYKVDIKGNGGPPRGVAVVCFHGHPRPWEVKDTWVKEEVEWT